MDAQRLLAIHFWDDGDMLGTLCPAGPHKSPTLLAGVLGLVRCHGSIHSTTWTLSKDLQASPIHIETHGVIYVPLDPSGAPQVYYLENKGPPPYPSYSKEFIPQYGTFGYYYAFGGPYDIYILLFGPL